MNDVGRYELRLYGRDELMNALVKRAVQGGTITVVRGPPGIGKTAILKALRDRLLVENLVNAPMYHELMHDESPVDRLVSNLSNELLDLSVLPRSDLTELRTVISSFSLRHVWKLVTSMTIDIMSHFKTKNTYQTLSGFLHEFYLPTSFRAQAKRLAYKKREHPFSAFRDLLSALDSAHITGCILIDAIDKAGQEMRSSLEVLAANLPSTWSLVLALNDETNDGVEVLRTMIPTLSYYGASERVVSGLTDNDVSEWYLAKHGRNPQLTEVRKAVGATGGRPLFLLNWVSDPEGNPISELVPDGVWDGYRRQVTDLPEDARSLLARLALFPEEIEFSLELCATLSRADNFEAAEATISRLIQANFLHRTQARMYQFSHALIREMVRSREVAVLKEAALDVLSAFVDHLPDWKGVFSDYAKLQLYEYAGQADKVQQLAEPTGAQLRAAGMSEAALNAFELASHHADPDAESRLSCQLQIAEIHVERGYYDQALTLLNTETWIGSSRKPEADKIAGTALLRLNRYSEAKTRLREADHGFQQSGDRVNSLSARRRLSTVLLDQDQCQEAIKLAASLVEEARQEHLPRLLFARCLRTLARALARAGRYQEAVDAAQQAIKIAKDKEARRDEGNGHLALAEAWRHSGDYKLAIDSYASALTVAKELANRDSLLWSTLGMSDALLLLHNLGAAKKELVHLGSFLANGRDIYPLEHCHWNLSLATIGWLCDDDGSREALSAAVDDYRRFSIEWPAEYARVLVTEQSPPWPKKL